MRAAYGEPCHQSTHATFDNTDVLGDHIWRYQVKDYLTPILIQTALSRWNDGVIQTLTALQLEVILSP